MLGTALNSIQQEELENSDIRSRALNLQQPTYTISRRREAHGCIA